MALRLSALRLLHKLGATSPLIRGYDPRPDAVQYGDELIPRVRELAADHDAASCAGEGVNHR
jgi:alkanesulfonate monooxygenase